MSTTQDLQEFVRWLHHQHRMEICRLSFGEFRPERFPEALINEFVATRKGRPLEAAVPTSSAPQPSVPPSK